MSGVARWPDFEAGRRGPEEVPLLPRRDPDDEIGDAVPDAVVAQLLDDANLGLLSDDGRRRLEIGLEVGRRPGELCRLAFDCLAYDERVTENGSTETKPVLVHDMRKVNVVGCRLPVHEHTAELIADQQAAVRARFPTRPAPSWSFSRPSNAQRRASTDRFDGLGQRAAPVGEPPRVVRGPARSRREPAPAPRQQRRLVRFDPARVFPYALRHSYAQRHVNAGTPVEVLKELMGHDCLNTTSAYYRITADRKRRAIKTVMPFQMTVSGVRLALVGEPTTAISPIRPVGDIGADGSCVEPSNVRANGAACDFRYRCFGCAHFRTDPSYLPELRPTCPSCSPPGNGWWPRCPTWPTGPVATPSRPAKRSTPSPSNHRLRTRPRPARPPDRATVTEAIELLRKGRAEWTPRSRAVPRMVAQPAPAVFPAVAAETGRSR